MAHSNAPYRIADVGVSGALHLLVPYVRAAGKLAEALQPRIAALTERTEKGGESRFTSALTDADLLVEDRLGGDLLTLFSDASFCGEERKADRISHYIPDGRPYIITLDPVNSTLYYRDGLPIYETIVTICDREWKMLGAIVYRPAFDELFLAHDHMGQHRAVRKTPVEMREHLMSHLNPPKVVYLDAAYSDKAELVRAAGYTPIFPWRDYAGEKDWRYASCDVLTGRCRGVLMPGGQLIDCKAFGFIAACAGGVWIEGAFDPATLSYATTVSASDRETADLLQSLL